MKKSSLHKIEKAALSLFLVLMLTTAASMVTFIWTQPENETLFMGAATLFIVGLASFLTWLPLMLYRVLDKPAK